MANINSLAFVLLVLLSHLEMESTHYEKTEQQQSCMWGLSQVLSEHGPFQPYGSFDNMGLWYTLPSRTCPQPTVTTPDEDNALGSAVLSVPIESWPRGFEKRRQGGFRACTSKTADTTKSALHCRKLSNTTTLILVTIPVPLCMHSLRATDIMVLAVCENAIGMIARERMFYNSRIVGLFLRASGVHNATVPTMSFIIDVEFHDYPRMISTCTISALKTSSIHEVLVLHCHDWGNLGIQSVNADCLGMAVDVSLSQPCSQSLPKFPIDLIDSSLKMVPCLILKCQQRVKVVSKLLEMINMINHYTNVSNPVSHFQCIITEFKLLRNAVSSCPLPHENNPTNCSLIRLLQPQCKPVMYIQHNLSTIDADNHVKTCRNASTAQTVLPFHFISEQFHCIISVLYLLVTIMLIQSHLCKKDHRDRNRKSTEQGTNVGTAAFSIASCTEKACPDVGHDSSGKPPWRQKTDVLHDIIHHLWRFTHRDVNDTSSHSSVTLQQRGNFKCHSSTSPLCSVCEDHVRHHLRRTKHHANTYTESKMSAISNMTAGLFRPTVIHAYPVTRFLPDPTRNPHQDLAHVGYRLATLSALPASVPVSRIRLADAGFYSRGVNDQVTCYSCHVQHSGWTRDDQPMEIHRRLSPNCPHVLQNDGQPAAAGPATVASGGNRSSDTFQHHQATASVLASNHVEDGEGSSLVTNSGHTSVLVNGDTSPRTQQNENEPTPPTRRSETSPSTSASRTDPSSSTRTSAEPPSSSNTRPVSGNVSRPVEQASVSSTERNPGSQNTSPERRNPGPEVVASLTDNSSSVTATSDVRGPSSSAASENPRRSLFPRPRLELGGAVYPMYQSMDSRRRSFTNWDDTRAPPLNEILLSGMFYAGYSDCVRCFYCGVGLKHWVVTDDVWTEHVRWRPECQYLRVIKGDDFIRETQRRLANTNSAPPEGSSRNANTRPSATSQPATSRSANPSAAAAPTTSPSVTAATATSAATRALSLGHSTTSMAPMSGNSSSSSSSSNSGASDAQSGAGNSRGGATATVQVNATDQQRTLAHLQAENRALNRNMQCRVCHRAPVNTLLLPCGHLVVCETCAGSVTSCPLCSQRVQAITQVHLA